ncbi:MAG: signal peptidase II, partial [Candidatus Omnitrophica bacterium]|nr:signal peptidase II [Candidatus Omnitrophota bacterium]
MPAGKRKDLIFSLFLLFLFICVLSVDRYSKSYILNKLSPLQSRPIIKGIFHLTLVYNTGAAFGLFKDNNFILIILSLAAVFLLIRYFKDTPLNRSFKVAFVLISAGAVGNLIDRISFGYVVDFLDFRIWPVFNLADTSISCGIIIMLYSLLLKKEKDVPTYFKG